MLKRFSSRGLSQKSWLGELRTMLIIGFVVFAARSTLADHYWVPTGSMLPTVREGDRLLVDKSQYGLRIPFSTVYLARFAQPAVGDVVVLKSPEDGVTLVKRVVAVPGDRVSVRGGRLYINGAPVQILEAADGPSHTEVLAGTPHALLLNYSGGKDYGPTTIAKDRYLLLGDNRGNSHDSRYFGPVPGNLILGRALGIYYSKGFTWREL